MNCKECKKLLGKKGFKIKCSGECKLWFHDQCTGLTKEEIKLVSNKKKTWICEACLEDEEFPGVLSESEGENEELSRDTDSEESEAQVLMEKNGIVAPRKKRTGKVTLEDLMHKLEDLLKENREFNKRMNTYEKELKSIKTQIVDLKEDNDKLKKELKELKHSKETQDQEKLKNNVIIQGLPIERANTEELTTYIMNVGKIVKVDLTEADFICQRMGKTMLKVKFNEIDKKKEFMTAKKKTVIKSNLIGFKEELPIYINHDMTEENQKLFKEARDLKKQGKFKYVWFANSKVLMRKTETSKVLPVDSFEALKNLSNPKN